MQSNGVHPEISLDGIPRPSAHSYLHLPFLGWRLRKLSEEVIGVALALVVVAAWCQHVYSCAVQGTWGFLALGAILTPVGVVNGFGIWLGLW